jgi:hypothetical protein
MLEKNTLIKVRNRDNGSVGYSIPDLGINHRQFLPGETKEITMEELRKLHFTSGGDYIIENCLVIENEEALAEIFQYKNIEPEYFYTEEDVKRLLTEGSLDELLDCLDFAPNGVIDLVKSLAVKLQINDVSKRDAIFAKTGLNVNNAIAINKETEEVAEKPVAQRRVAPAAQNESAPSRRVNTGKYTVKN